MAGQGRGWHWRTPRDQNTNPAIGETQYHRKGIDGGKFRGSRAPQVSQKEGGRKLGVQMLQVLGKGAPDMEGVGDWEPQM